MDIYNKSGKFFYEIENVCRLFFPNEKFKEKTDFIENDADNNYIIINGREDDMTVYFKVCAKIGKESLLMEKSLNKNIEDFENEYECGIARIIFEILSKITCQTPSWGIVTGVRPVKLYRSLLKEGGEEYADKYFLNKLLVSDKKLKLARKTNVYEENTLNLSGKDSFSLYISIPFCPSRCSYCSFVSQSIEKCKDLIPRYLELLFKEIEYTGKLAKSLSLKLETVYIGGGTPTILSDLELLKLIETINNNFDMKTCREFTVEAGRPDTITKEKLSAMKKGKISRISINPQTLCDDVLKVIGRKHTAAQTIKAFNLAREIGFDNINMDLIAGLPTESPESFYETVNKVCKLDPEGITIHTLSLKRASYLNVKEESQIDNSHRVWENTVDSAYKRLSNSCYHPYYLYRQSRMVENLENIGWAKSNRDCLYNIYIMDETHTILACGAGAVTKLKEYSSGKIERIFNYKFAYEYISGFSEILQRKRKVVDFYEKLQ